MNAAGTITRVRHIDPDVDDLIAIDGGFVALHSDRLSFWPRVADVGAAELTFKATTVTSSPRCRRAGSW